MRNVVLQAWITLDGLAAGPNGSVDFVPASTQGDQGFGQEQMALLERVDTIVLGRITYQMFAGFWPRVTEGAEKPFADRLNATPKVVFSRTLERAPWGTWDEALIVNGDAAEELAALKERPGKSILLWGSISLAQALMRANLIDEYRLVLCPVVLGSGRRLFRDDLTPPQLTLVDVQAFARGAVSVRYYPRR